MFVPFIMRSRSVLLCSLLSSACAPQLAVKPPSAATPAQVLEVSEQRPGRAGAPSSIRLGNASVSDISGTLIQAPGTTPYGRAPDPDARKYRFKVLEGVRVLGAECSEQARDAPYFGLGKAAVDLYCTCSEGNAVRAALLVSEGRGEAVLPDHARYAVWETHEDVRGHRVSAILGYRFQNAKAEGAVDITAQPRAYLPSALPAEQRLPLTCLYAALLLHRPVK